MGIMNYLKKNFKYKQVIIVRTDLKMSTGKTAAQTAHAAVTAAEIVRKKHPDLWYAWINEGQKKIVLKVDNEKELIHIKNESNSYKLNPILISDMGLTELKPGTITALGIGPAPSILIDKITGKLPLL
jgi:PTH2 family peptidyl-tRNA hydrolase